MREKKKQAVRAEKYLDLVKRGLEKLNGYYKLYLKNSPTERNSPDLRLVGLITMYGESKPKWFIEKGVDIREGKLRDYARTLFDYLRAIEHAEPSSKKRKEPISAKSATFVNGGGRKKLYANAGKVLKEGLDGILKKGGELIGSKFYK